MNKLWLILIAFLVGVSIFSVVKYVSSVQEKYALITTIDKMKAEVAVLEDEKQNLNRSLDKEKVLNNTLETENASLNESLKADEEKLAKLGSDLQETLKKIEELNTQVTALNDEKEKATLLLSEATQERETLKSRMNSIPELKQMSKELKKKMRVTSHEVTTQIKKETIILGNRGFLVRNGKPTYPPKVKIEVEPISQ